MANPVSVIDTAHDDMIHDAQFDYYGKYLATCSSDRTIKIFEVSENSKEQVLVSTLKGHDGPVWEIAWAHPKFGNLLASCSYDKRVLIWKETSHNQWIILHEVQHESSVNAVAWAPAEYGLTLAAASSDGSVSIIWHKDERNWEKTTIKPAHNNGVNAVSWAPAMDPPALLSGQAARAVSSPPRRIATGGCDNLIKIWRYDEQAGGKGDWVLEVPLEGHGDWVRDVAWAPNIGRPIDILASCSQDGSVFIWSREDGNKPWEKCNLTQLKDNIAWRVSWSVTGNILAVSGSDNKVTLWKESLDREWKCITAFN